MPTHLSPHRKEGFRFESPPRSELLGPYTDVKLDPYIMTMLEQYVAASPLCGQPDATRSCIDLMCDSRATPTPC